MAPSTSPFLSPHSHTTPNSLALIHLQRGHQIPIILRETDDENKGYEEGKVLNTRFGSFPHSTLINLPWGSQVRASKVDTGSRGKRGAGKKRKRGEKSEAKGDEDGQSGVEIKEAVVAETGFVHILLPTPEIWTASLPHRTQVVYTPDYSYILQWLRVRPGTTLIEAGAGSGSFTHAAARAVFNGYPEDEHTEDKPAQNDGEAQDVNGSNSKTKGKGKRKRRGKVFSYEFHAQRHEKLQNEIADHGLDGIVQITHRDVCKDGFLVGPDMNESPNAEAIFLDLPAPWIALPHLSRRSQAPETPPVSTRSTDSKSEQPQEQQNPEKEEDPKPRPSSTFKSPLSPTSPIRICTFNPCIEQVQRTVSTLRRLGWIDINMVEIAQKKIDVRRERIGLSSVTERGVMNAPASVAEALGRLREVEGRSKLRYSGSGAGGVEAEADEQCEELEMQLANGSENAKAENRKSNEQRPKGRKERDTRNGGRLRGSAAVEDMVARKTFKDGRLVHRTEPDIKTHTSYLVFAILPRVWSSEDEERARKRWSRVSEDVKKVQEKNKENRTENAVGAGDIRDDNPVVKQDSVDENNDVDMQGI